MSGIDRREFLLRTAGGALTLAALARRGIAQDVPNAPAAAPAAAAKKSLELRELGATGRTMPRLGLGCTALAGIKSDDKAIALVQRAHELGIRYFDVTPTAGKGRAERLLGEALKGVKREELWIATRMEERRADAARRAIAAALERLGTDYIDSMHVKTTKDREAASEGESSLDVMREMQSKKVVRFLGLASSKGVMYAKRAIQRFSYEIALIPVNPTDPQRFNFIAEFLPFAEEKKLAVVGMQTIVTGRKPGTEPIGRKDCITYSLAQPGVDVIVPRCTTIEALEEVHAAALDFTPPPESWLRELEKRAAASDAATEETPDEAEPEGDGSDER